MMKGIVAVICLVVSGALCEAQAPYPASGWRPQGPAFELPERTPLDPRNKVPQKQEYLPPTESTTPRQEYGPPEVDVSVQGLPTQEQLPIFQLSPVNGQQYVGPTFNNDLRSLEQNLRESQLRAQQNIYREFARQRQLEAATANANANRAANPRQFVPKTTTTTTAKPDDSRTTPETTTEALNQGQIANNKEKVSVEVSKQNIQEYPPELFLNSLAQLQLQNQYAPVQLGQLRAPIYLEPSQKVIDSQLLAQQYLQLQQQVVQSQPQFTQAQGVAPTYLVPEGSARTQSNVQPSYQYEAVQPVNQQPSYQYEAVQPVQTLPQQVYLQPQPNQLLPRPQDQQNDDQQTVQPQVQPQFVYQYQPEYQIPNQVQTQEANQQPQGQVQQPNQFQVQQPNQFYQQPLNSYQTEQQFYDPLYQQQVAQIAQQQIYQQQLAQQQQLIAQQQLYQQQLAQQQLASQQGQGSLQSGFDVNQQGNGIDQREDKDDDKQDDGNTATAVATAFGTRTQPRVYATYGVPVPIPRVQSNPGYNYQTTTETQDENTEGPTVAEATAVAGDDKRRPAKIARVRQGRLRPIFTLDKSGHLVLAQEQ